MCTWSCHILPLEISHRFHSMRSIPCPVPHGRPSEAWLEGVKFPWQRCRCLVYTTSFQLLPKGWPGRCTCTNTCSLRSEETRKGKNGSFYMSTQRCKFDSLLKVSLISLSDTCQFKERIPSAPNAKFTISSVGTVAPSFLPVGVLPCQQILEPKRHWEHKSASLRAIHTWKKQKEHVTKRPSIFRNIVIDGPQLSFDGCPHCFLIG